MITQKVNLNFRIPVHGHVHYSIANSISQNKKALLPGHALCGGKRGSGVSGSCEELFNLNGRPRNRTSTPAVACPGTIIISI